MKGGVREGWKDVLYRREERCDGRGALKDGREWGGRGRGMFWERGREAEGRRDRDEEPRGLELVRTEGKEEYSRWEELAVRGGEGVHGDGG